MSKWKLLRDLYGSEEFTFEEGDDVTIGRSLSNTLTLASIVISRNHCVMKVQTNNILITDLNSSNGIYVNDKRIPSGTPYELKDSDVIGIGWTVGAIAGHITDEEKYVFKVIKENCSPPVIKRIKFQSENELDEIEEKVAALENGNNQLQKSLSPVLSSKLSLKRKCTVNCDEIKKEIKQEKKKCPIITMDDDVIDLLSESDHEANLKGLKSIDNVKLEPISEESHKEPLKDQIKTENRFLEYEAFNVKQEYLGYDDEPIKIDSDSDSESEHWYLRLSQNSPGKPFNKLPKERIETKQEDSSYSQMDDDFVTNISFADNDIEEEFMDDIITIPPQPPQKNAEPEKLISDIEEFPDDIISICEPVLSKTTSPQTEQLIRDEVDGFNADSVSKEIETNLESVKILVPNDVKKAQMIEPLQLQKKSKHTSNESKAPSSISKHGRVKKHSSKRHISNSQKEERKKKLKEIATKEKETDAQSSMNSLNASLNKTTSNVKMTTSNRGAFLTNAIQIVKPVKRKDDSKESKSKHKSTDLTKEGKSKQKSNDEPKEAKSNQKNIKSPTTPSDEPTIIDMSSENRENKKKHSSKREEHKSSKHKDKHNSSKSKSSHNKSHESSKVHESRVPLKCLKPLTESDKTFSGKPFSKVDPLPPKKPKKTVRFSEAGPDVHLFEIEPGNKLKKTSMVKNSLLDIRHLPVFSLEKITLMKILRWNPHWLEEQINNNEPPPILGHNNPPMSIFHSFVNHHQYVQLIGDLLLMEIWECLTLAYMKIRTQNFGVQMRIGSLPPIPTQERNYELFSLSVNISLPSHDTKNVPRTGEILLVTFGPDNAKTQRFFFVHNVRCLPSPPNNIHSFYSVALHATYTDKMKTLKLGEPMVGRSLAYINKELNLFEAMEYLAGSPLSDAILRPEPRHFERNIAPDDNIKSLWTKTLNPSQQAAVTASVSAALGDKPSIQMVQGPPGTGKSSVICAIVMTYFYNEQGKRHPNRAKIMICATSNAAVDELVIRLLNIRQNLPKSERFRMVRVGRAEAMAARARDVSSQQLAQRDAQRLQAEPVPRIGLQEEISHLEAKINMWKTAAQDAKDPVRVAYCQGRVNDLIKRITLVRAGGGGSEELRPEQLINAERRIIEGADIVVTTLASAHNHKMKGLKRRIALCIIDEAGQAIEPETLIPLTLDVTRLTLIGDPQQLPGYICSQRAKKHGLGESLFSRLTSCTEHWNTNPVDLLNQQYRMHVEIADYPNRAFYGGRVSTAVQLRPNIPIPPYCILSIASGDKGQGSSGANEIEAWGVTRLVAALSVMLRPLELSLAVITPYNAHKELIKKNLRLLQGPSECPVEVNTVDSFQGQERDVMVVSLARSQGVGFLTDAGRMNVMLTRAKHALLICLNPFAMVKNHQWRTLIEDAQRRKMYMSLPNNMCQPVSPGQTTHDDILKYITSAK